MWTLYIHISPSNKYYVGITSRTTYERWGKNGMRYRKQLKFWRAIQKYGWNNFKHIVVSNNLPKWYVLELEKYFIELLKSNTKYGGYNISSGGEHPTLGLTYSSETRLKISNANKGRSINKGVLNGMYGTLPTTVRRVKCVDTGEIFESIKSASKTIGRHPSTLSDGIKKGFKCAGMRWEYVE